MSSSRPNSPSKGASDEEHLLPTYEQFQATEPQASDTLPEETATPDQIRHFLVQLLAAKRGISVDHAQRIASKWTISSGKELRSYPPLMYTEIFGREDGYIVYREVKTLIYQAEIDKLNEEKKNVPFWTTGESCLPLFRFSCVRFCQWTRLICFLTVLTLSVALVCEGLVMWSLIYHMVNARASKVGLVFSWLAVFPMTYACIAVLVSTFCTPRSPEKRVEFEMKEFWNPPRTSQT